MNKRLLKNKRGSHVGVILSFVIFVTFLVFLYSAIEPIIKTQQEKDSLLSFIQEEVIKNITKDVTTSVVEFPNSGHQCVYFEKILGTDTNSKIIAQDKDGDVLDESGWDSDGKIFVEKGHKRLVKIFFLEGFQLPDTRPTPCNTESIEVEDYNITYTRTKSHIYESAIGGVINIYNNGNAEELKQYFKVPVGSDFGLGFRDSEGNITSTNEGNILTNVYSKEINIEYIDEGATERYGVLIVRVW